MRFTAVAIDSKPHRGCLFIGNNATRPNSFCFSAARRPSNSRRGLRPEHRIWKRGLLANAAPPKNKKNHSGACGCYKQATPTGFGSDSEIFNRMRARGARPRCYQIIKMHFHFFRMTTRADCMDSLLALLPKIFREQFQVSSMILVFVTVAVEYGKKVLLHGVR